MENKQVNISSENDETKEVKTPKRGNAKKKEPKVVQKTKDAKDEELELMKKQLAEVNEMLKQQSALVEMFKQQAQQANQLQQATIETKADDDLGETIMVGCNAVYGVTLTSQKGDVVLQFEYGEEVECDRADLKEVFKKASNKKVFEQGLCYFDDDNEYKEFRIKRTFIYDEDEIMDLINGGDANQIYSWLDGKTKTKTNIDIMHMILYKLADLELDKRLERIPYASRATIEKFFGVELVQAANSLQILKNLVH